MAATTSLTVIQTSKRCSLLGLPPEVRLEIYHLAFESLVFKVDIAEEQVRCCGLIEKLGRPLCRSSVGLIRTCLQLYNEALPVLLKNYNLRILFWAPNSIVDEGDEIDCVGFVAGLKVVKNVTMHMSRGHHETNSSLVDPIKWTLEEMSYSKSLRFLQLIFEPSYSSEEDNDDPELPLINVFRSVKCQGAVEMYIRKHAHMKAGVEDEYKALVGLLNA